mgnify:FL=1
MSRVKSGFSCFTWHISGLTKAVGEEMCSSTDEGRSLHWHDGDNYWLVLTMGEGEEIYAEIQDSNNPATTYAAVGYCQYHAIPHTGVGSHFDRGM